MDAQMSFFAAVCILLIGVLACGGAWADSAVNPPRRPSAIDVPRKTMSPRELSIALLAVAISLPAGAAQWTATFGHVGPLKLGMSLATVNEVLGAHYAPPKIPEADPSGRCFYVDPPPYPGVYLMVIDGRLARIDIGQKSDIKTAKGVSVGGTQASVLAAYGSGVAIEPAAYYPGLGRYLTVLSPDKRYGIRFVTLNGKIKYYFDGTAQTIRYDEGCA